MKVKTIDVQAKEYFDKSGGNSYFSAQVTVNYGMKSEKVLYLPLQYGYDNHYETMTMKKLIDEGIIKADTRKQLYRYCEENNIILRSNKETNCKKREVVSFGSEN
ncbi:MAG: hypothetical protein ACOC1K_05285 [Nanoarchaeota archaeon]